MKELILYGLYTPVIFSKEVIPIKQLTNQFLKEEGKERDVCIYEYTPLPDKYSAFGMKIDSNYCTWDSNYIR